eukprot:15479325-Alexandrium_andersonii.AAC.1
MTAPADVSKQVCLRHDTVAADFEDDSLTPCLLGSPILADKASVGCSPCFSSQDMAGRWLGLQKCLVSRVMLRAVMF